MIDKGQNDQRRKDHATDLSRLKPPPKTDTGNHKGPTTEEVEI